MVKTIALIGACTLSAALGAGAVVLFSASPSQTVQPTAISERVSAPVDAHSASVAEMVELHARLDRVDTERVAMQTQIAGLSRELAAIREQAPESEPTNTVSDESAGVDEEENTGRYGDFVNVGFSQGRAAEFVDRIASVAMERLYLRDTALREDWIGTDRYNEALDELQNREQAFRVELGDDDYDRYLYASGSSNRVRIDSVIPGSPAQSAGLQAGDTIRSYDDFSIFNIGEVQTSTSSGVAGEYIRIDYERDGELAYSYIPRGPLGVNLRSFRKEP
ncbi:MAG: PDZ domain-containing protein [Pseudomonadota bacterium]